MVTTQRDHQKGRLFQAIQAFKQTSNVKIRAIARSYDVNRKTLVTRMYGGLMRRDAQLSYRKLTLTEKETLVRWILSMDEWDLSPRIADVRKLANILFTERIRYSSNDLLSVSKY